MALVYAVLGWVCFSLVAGLWLGATLFRPASRSYRRPGYVMPPASSSTNPQADGTYGIHRTRVGFSSYDPPGQVLAAPASPQRHHLRNSFTAPSSFGELQAGRPGRTRRAPAGYGETA